MMWLMFDGDPYGHLSVKGSVIPPDKLGVILGVERSVVDSLLAELEQYGVFSRTEDGVIYSRRMVSDRQRREINAMNGAKGGNPRLSQSDKPKVKPRVNPLRADAVADSITQGRKERASEVDAAFEALWITFERYGAKGKALAYWKRLSEEERASVARNAPAYVESTPGCAYRKQLEGWINPDNRLWERPIVQRPPDGAPINGKMTSDQAREAIAALRAKHGIPPGGAIDSHLVPDHIREALR